MIGTPLKKIFSKEEMIQRFQIQAHYHYTKGNFYQALFFYQKALLQDPANILVLSNIGVVYTRQRELEKAEGFFLKALEIDSNHSITLNNYCNCLQKLGRLEEALDLCEKSLAHEPNLIGALLNKGVILRKLGKIDQALKVFRQILKRNPTHSDAQFNVGFCLLYQGKWEEAWPYYEWRWKMKECKAKKLLEEKPWTGQLLKRKTILLYHEQGYGDTIQMSRYASILSAQGARVILKAQSSMVELLKHVQGVDEVISDFPIADAYNYQIPLFSLPLFCKTALESIPCATPYISMEKRSLEFMAYNPKELKIGLVWSTSQTNLISRLKSVPLEFFKKILSLKGVRFFSLQVDQQKYELYQAPFMPYLEDVSPFIRSFYDTAQIIQNLDILISVDTAAAHLAGALNKPVWILLPKVPDWRWGLSGDTSAWYPSARLFRQIKQGDWTTPLKEIERALRHELKK